MDSTGSVCWGGQTFPGHRQPPSQSKERHPFPSWPPVLSHWLGFGWREQTDRGTARRARYAGRRGWARRARAGALAAGSGVAPAVRLSGLHPAARPLALWTRRGWVLLASSGLTVAIVGEGGFRLAQKHSGRPLTFAAADSPASPVGSLSAMSHG